MNVLFLGRANTYLAFWHIQKLSSAGHRVTVINTQPHLVIRNIPGFDGPIYNLYEDRWGFSNTFTNWIRFYPRSLFNSPAWHSYDRDTLKRLTEIMEREHVDAVFGWWGADVLYEMLLLTRLKVKLIWALIVYPSALFAYGAVMERVLSHKLIRKVDGLVFGSPRQKDYVLGEFNLDPPPPNVTFAQTASEDAYFKKRLTKFSDDDGLYHVAFIGRTDFSRDRRKVKDDIRYLLKELDHPRLRTHILETDAEVAAGNVVRFPSFSQDQILNGEFAEFLTRFDACLVAANYRDTSRHARFDNGFPARMAVAVAAGIPLIFPKGTMLACSEFAHESGIGYDYSNAEDLLNWFGSVEYARAAEKAVNVTPALSYDAQYTEITDMLQEL